MTLLENKQYYFSKDKSSFYRIEVKGSMYSLVTGTPNDDIKIDTNQFETPEEAVKEANNFVSKLGDLGFEAGEIENDTSIFKIALNQLDSKEINEFEQKLKILKTLIDAYHIRNKHPFRQFLNISGDEEEASEVSLLDDNLAIHIKTLDSTVLVTIFRMVQQHIYFSYKAARLVLEEIIYRKDAIAQVKIADQFKAACYFYDAGHRFWSDTNHDVFLDDYFPKFESIALLSLLKGASHDMLYSDAMDELFVHALKNTDDEKIQKEILEVLFEYKNLYEKYAEDDHFSKLLTKIQESTSPIVLDAIEMAYKEKENNEKLLAAIEEEDIPKLKELKRFIKESEVAIAELVVNQIFKNRFTVFDFLVTIDFDFHVVEDEDSDSFLMAKLRWYESDKHFNALSKLLASEVFHIDEMFKKFRYSFSSRLDLLGDLVKCGADVNADGGRLLLNACLYGYLEKVKFLLDNGARLNVKEVSEGRYNGMTPLHLAVYSRSTEIVNLLIDASADVNAESQEGTPLTVAYKRGSEELIELLKNANAHAPKDEILKARFLAAASKAKWSQLLEFEEEILEFYPEEFLIILNLAQANYLASANYTKSAEYGQRALSIKSGNSSLNILVMSLIRLGEYQQIIDIFHAHEASLQLEEELAENIIGNMIIAYCGSGQAQKGLEMLSPYFTKVSEAPTARGVYYFNIACLYAICQQYEKMLSAVLEALKRQYTSEEFLNDNDFKQYHEDEFFKFLISLNHKEPISLYGNNINSETEQSRKILLKITDSTKFVKHENCTIREQGSQIQTKRFSSTIEALKAYYSLGKEYEIELSY